MKRQALLELMAGAYSARLLLQLCRSPLAGLLTKFCEPARLAQIYDLNPDGLRQILDFLAHTTELIQRRGERYRWRSTTPLSIICFQLEKFEGAYGEAVGCILDGLRDGRPNRGRVDQVSLSVAFKAMGESVNAEVVRAIEEARINCLADLGCGTGALLRTLARRNPAFTGIGVDSNRDMCRQAKNLVSQAGLRHRIITLAGPAPFIFEKLSVIQRKQVQGIHGASFLNEFFGGGKDGAVRVLRELGRLFPGRRAWFVDYHGCLGTKNRRNLPLNNLLQDVAQIASGQGVPPSNPTVWEQVYRDARCYVASQRTFRAEAVEWCLHEVILPGARSTK